MFRTVISEHLLRSLYRRTSKYLMGSPVLATILTDYLLSVIYFLHISMNNYETHNLKYRRGPVFLDGPLCDILVVDVRSVDFYQDVH
jgi:hypothetical protein